MRLVIINLQHTSTNCPYYPFEFKVMYFADLFTKSQESTIITISKMEVNRNVQDVEAQASSATSTGRPKMQSVAISVNREASAGSGASGSINRDRGGRDLSISGFALLGFLAWIGWKMVCIGNDTFEFCLGEFLFLSGLLLLSIIVLFTTRTFYNNAFDDGLAFHSLMVLVMDIVSSVMLAAIFIIHCYYSIIVYFRRCHGEKTEANEMAALIGLTVLAVQWIIIIACFVVAFLALCVECFDEIKRRRQTNYGRMPANAPNV